MSYRRAKKRKPQMLPVKPKAKLKPRVVLEPKPKLKPKPKPKLERKQ